MSLFTIDQIGAIDKASVRILETIGVRVDHARVLDLLAAAGARVDSEKMTATIPEELIRSSLRKCPATVRLGGGDGKTHDLRPGAPSCFWTPNALRLVQGKKAAPIDSASFAEFVRLCDKLENVQGIAGTNICDYPAPARDVVGFRLLAGNTQKHIRSCTFTAEGAKAVVEMGKVILDGKTFRELPIVSFGYTCVSPLHWPQTALDLFVNTAGHGIPIMINAEPMAGGTAPSTLAGTVALANAELLSGVVINQVIEEGRPCILDNLSHMFDMKTAVVLTGCVQNGLMVRGTAEIGQHYRIPTAGWMSTESMIADGQAALEKTLTALLYGLGKTSVVWGIGTLETQAAVSFAQAVIDNDIAGAVLRMQAGIEVNDETIAFDELRAVVADGRDFLSDEHTMSHWRDELAGYPQVASRVVRDKWQQRGSTSLEERAEARASAILAEERTEYLSPAQKCELKKIEQAHLKKMAV